MNHLEHVDLARLFSDLQNQLLTSFGVIKRNVRHSGAKGFGTETKWVEVLRNYLPKRYGVEKGFAVDANGCISDEQDIIVFDPQYTPFILRHDGLLYIPAESVYLLIESKQTLSKQHLEYAGKKAQSVRKLRRTSARIPHAGGTFEPKKPFRIPAGIVALDSEWSPPFNDAFRSALENLSSCPDYQIDFGCVLNSGSFHVEYIESAPMGISLSKSDHALMHFLFTVFETLQSLGTVPAIDVPQYKKWIDS